MTTIFERTMRLKIRLADAWDIRSTGLGVLEVIGDDATIELPAYRGAPGTPGRDGMRPQIHTVDTAADIPTLGDLTSEQIGHGWRVAGSPDVTFLTTDPADGTLTLETAADWLGMQGETGPPPELEIGSVATSDTDSDVQLEPVGDGRYRMHLTLRRGPRGAVGPQGPAAAIRRAADYDDEEPPASGDVPTWDSSTSQWRPRRALAPRGPYTIPSSGFSAQSVSPLSSTTRKLIASREIPAQPFDWRPWITGHVQGASGVTAKVGIAVYAGPDETNAVLVARAPSLASLSRYTMSIAPHFEDELTPDADETRMPADQPTYVYVYAERTNSSIDGWQTYGAGSHLSIMVLPAEA